MHDFALFQVSARGFLRPFRIFIRYCVHICKEMHLLVWYLSPIRLSVSPPYNNNIPLRRPQMGKPVFIAVSLVNPCNYSLFLFFFSLLFLLLWRLLGVRLVKLLPFCCYLCRIAGRPCVLLVSCVLAVIVCCIFAYMGNVYRLEMFSF